MSQYKKICKIVRPILLAHIPKTLYIKIRKGELTLKYERYLYGKIQLDEEVLMQNNIYHNINLEYYKTKSNNSEKYGIEIVKTEYINNEEKQENKYIEALTASEEKVENILSKLKNNQVTPVGLEYIIIDMLT